MKMSSRLGRVAAAYLAADDAVVHVDVVQTEGLQVAGLAQRHAHRHAGQHVLTEHLPGQHGHVSHATRTAMPASTCSRIRVGED